MSNGETFVNYALIKDTKKAHKAGVFPDMGVAGEDEERHISELERRMAALDDKETYVTVKTLVKHHKDTFVRTLDYMNKEGEREKNETDKRI